MNFRYEITPKAKLSTFEPKEMPSNVEPLAVRATQLGGILKGHLNKLPRTSASATLWEAP